MAIDRKIYQCPQTLPPFRHMLHVEHAAEMIERRKRQTERTATDMRPLIAETNRKRKLAGQREIPWRKQLQMVMLTRGKYNPAQLVKLGHR